MVKETKPLSSVQKVLIESFGEFIIQQGGKEELTFEGEQAFIDRMSVQVQEGQLVIKTRGFLLEHITWFIQHGWQPLSLKCLITIKDLESLELWGAGKIQVGQLKTPQFNVRLKGAGEIIIEDLHTQTLYAHLPGAGRISISGETVHQNVTLSGTGSYESSLLKSTSANVHLTGIGSAVLWVTDSLTAAVRGMGSISYYGYPTVEEECHGLGKVIALGAPIQQDIFASSPNFTASTSSPTANEEKVQPSDSPSSSFPSSEDQENPLFYNHPKHPQDILANSIWGLIFIWAGTILLANNLGWLKAWLEHLPFGASTSLPHLSFGAWSLVSLGAGFLLLFEIVLRWIVPSLRKPWIGKLIFSLLLICVGLDGIISWLVILPAFLVLAGFLMVLRGIISHE